ncbi:hypothetical protein [Paenibacillus albiflavus]|uniref:hypothetical protein n=1 Tax=Paenibacillus albiflavus TaxID=2545760 RepID=UPI0014050AED|nr:hypothetical protein [Paenibacillus albiflavus]
MNVLIAGKVAFWGESALLNVQNAGWTRYRNYSGLDEESCMRTWLLRFSKQQKFDE